MHGMSGADLFALRWLDAVIAVPVWLLASGAFLLLHAGQTRPPAARGLLVTIGCGPKGEPAYALEASIFIAGAAIQWLRDALGIIRSANTTDRCFSPWP